MAVGFGHFAGRHELLLYGVDLERRKADCGGDLQCVLSDRTSPLYDRPLMVVS